MEKNKSMKIVAIVALVLSVIGLTVAFAAMSTTLTINGTATMDPESWDIHFANLSEANVTLGGEVVTPPTLTATHIGDYDVKLTKPGSSVSYTFDVVNDGSLNAYLDSFTKGTPVFEGVSLDKATADASIVENNFVYTLAYTNDTTIEQTGTIKTAGTEVAQNDQLLAGQTVNLTLTVAYKSTATEIPSDDVNITGLDASLIYAQLD